GHDKTLDCGEWFIGFFGSGVSHRGFPWFAGAGFDTDNRRHRSPAKPIRLGGGICMGLESGLLNPAIAAAIQSATA
ncbi:hypothetical protein, partial [Rhizobium ecuadorense]|uniref:hypothetical protein n=1 Tax=Rhizobium ecuadorense TaxID=1671795 RepID=UPI001AEBD4FD